MMDELETSATATSANLFIFFLLINVEPSDADPRQVAMPIV
jgi:hypothetical protein